MTSAESQAAMDNAAKAVRDFLIKNGVKDTSVYELVRPAVYHETITVNEREEIITAVDQERHQSHFHTSIQPITDDETLDVQHETRILPVENRVFEHDDFEEVQRRLEEERAKFRNHVERVEGEHTREVVPVVAGEHIHHHVREYIQPIVNRHVIEPRIIHSVVLVHEKHHNAAMHHQTSVLPPVTMAEFKRQGGVLTGREERFDFFEGEPRSIGGHLGNVEHKVQEPTNNEGAAGNRKTASSGVQSNATPESQSAATTQQLQTSAAPDNSSSAAPPFPIPERRSTIPPPTAQPTVDSNQAGAPQQPTQQQTATVNELNLGPAPAQPAPATSSAPVQPTSAGRWSLLPMHFARSSDVAHPPTRATQHAGPVMQAIHPPRPSVDQRQGPTARPGGLPTRRPGPPQ